MRCIRNTPSGRRCLIVDSTILYYTSVVQGLWFFSPRKRARIAAQQLRRHELRGGVPPESVYVYSPAPPLGHVPGVTAGPPGQGFGGGLGRLPPVNRCQAICLTAPIPLTGGPHRQLAVLVPRRDPLAGMV